MKDEKDSSLPVFEESLAPEEPQAVIPNTIVEANTTATIFLFINVYPPDMYLFTLPKTGISHSLFPLVNVYSF